MNAYQQLEDRFSRISALDDALRVLGWDTQVNMPPGGAEARAEQVAAMRLTIREKIVAPDVRDWLAEAEGEAGRLDIWKRANLTEMRRRFVHSTAVPAELVAALARANSACHMAWREARPASDFAKAKGPLETLLGLVKQSAAARAEATRLSPYEALMDLYEPGARTARIDAVFAELVTVLPKLVDEVLERQNAHPAPLMPDGPFPVEVQRRIGERFMRLLGFDFNHGRLDPTLHRSAPACRRTCASPRAGTRTGFSTG